MSALFRKTAMVEWYGFFVIKTNVKNMTVRIYEGEQKAAGYFK